RLAFGVFGEYVTAILAGSVALITLLLGLRIERVDLAAFIEVSETPASGCGIAVTVLHHDSRQHAASLPAITFLSNKELKHLFCDDGAVSVVAGPQPLHCRF